MCSWDRIASAWPNPEERLTNCNLIELQYTLYLFSHCCLGSGFSHSFSKDSFTMVLKMKASCAKIAFIFRKYTAFLFILLVLSYLFFKSPSGELLSLFPSEAEDKDVTSPSKLKPFIYGSSNVSAQEGTNLCRNFDQLPVSYEKN